MSSSSPKNDTNNSPSSSSEPVMVEPMQLPTIEEVRGQNIWNNCVVCSVTSGVMGGGLGLAMGLFVGALDNPIMQDEMTGRQQFIEIVDMFPGILVHYFLYKWTNTSVSFLL